MEISQEDLKNMSPEELIELQKKNCIFCHIISGKVQSKKIYEDDKCIAILDINPLNPGHILLLPKEHQTIMPQISDVDISHLFMVAKHLSNACLRALKAHGTNIFVANGVVAGQKSPHFMIHIVPRKEKDDVIAFEMKRNKISKKELENIQKLLVAKFRQETGEKEPVDLSKKPMEIKEKIVEAEFKEEKKEPKKPKIQKKIAIKPKKEKKAPSRKEKPENQENTDLDAIAKVLFDN